MILLIYGPPASGKTFLARNLAEALDPDGMRPLWHPSMLRHPPTAQKVPVRIVDNMTSDQVVKSTDKLQSLAETSNVLIVTVQGELDEATCREIGGGRFTVHLVSPTLSVPARS